VFTHPHWHCSLLAGSSLEPPLHSDGSSLPTLRPHARCRSELAQDGGPHPAPPFPPAAGIAVSAGSWSMTHHHQCQLHITICCSKA
jgi:hypothetical protein